MDNHLGIFLLKKQRIISKRGGLLHLGFIAKLFLFKIGN